MTGIKLSDYAKANGLSEEKIIEYLNKGYLKGILQDGEWQVFPSPIGLLIARITDSPFEIFKKHKAKVAFSSALIGLFVLNPSTDRHTEVVAEQVTSIISEFMPESSDPFAQLGMQLGASMVMAGLESNFSYHNYLLASSMSFNNKPVTFGIGGFVFNLSKIDKMTVAKKMAESKL